MNPWKFLKTTIIYQNPWIQLHVDDVVRPDGTPGTFGILKTKGGIGVVALNDSNAVYMVAQYRYATKTYSLEIPKGGFDTFDSNETPLVAAKRELQEETGITATTWKPLTTVNALMGYSNDIVHLFVATDLTHGVNSPDDTEVISCVEIPLEDIDSVVKDGIEINGYKATLTDATSLAAIYMVKS